MFRNVVLDYREPTLIQTSVQKLGNLLVLNSNESFLHLKIKKKKTI